MSETAAQLDPPVSVDAFLREGLAHGDAMIGTIAPILRHLLANDEHSVFGDEIIASVRGMLADVARQLLDACHAGGEGADHDPALIAALSESFVAHPGFLAHVHALTLEWQLTTRLQARLSLDPVISPLLQALIASPEPAVAAMAMALLASQARFAQTQRRMELPLGELPGDLLHAALLAVRGLAEETPELAEKMENADKQIRAGFDEGRSRLGLLSRLVTGMGGGATAALSVTHAGVGMFLTALALASRQDRDMTVLSTNEGQIARLVLGLRASGLKPAAIEEQFLALHPDVPLPRGFETLGIDQAAALLSVSAIYPGG